MTAPGPGYRALLLPHDLYCLLMAEVKEVHWHGSAVENDMQNKVRFRGENENRVWGGVGWVWGGLISILANPKSTRAKMQLLPSFLKKIYSLSSSCVKNFAHVLQGFLLVHVFVCVCEVNS